MILAVAACSPERASRKRQMVMDEAAGMLKLLLNAMEAAILTETRSGVRVVGHEFWMRSMRSVPVST